jgi:hypothetical protein
MARWANKATKAVDGVDGADIAGRVVQGTTDNANKAIKSLQMIDTK